MPERIAVTLPARPAPIRIDPSTAAVIVVDMQNDFGSRGGMFDRAGIDISGIEAAVAPTGRVLDAARAAGIPVIYLLMQHRAELSDMGAPDSPHCDHSGHRLLTRPSPTPVHMRAQFSAEWEEQHHACSRSM